MAVTGNSFSGLVNYEKAFDPRDIDQWQKKETKRSKFQLLGDIYKITEQQIEEGVRQQRG